MRHSPRPRVLYILFYFFAFIPPGPCPSLPEACQMVPGVSSTRLAATRKEEEEKRNDFGAQVASITRQHDRTLFFFFLARKDIRRKKREDVLVQTRYTQKEEKAKDFGDVFLGLLNKYLDYYLIHLVPHFLFFFFYMDPHRGTDLVPNYVKKHNKQKDIFAWSIKKAGDLRANVTPHRLDDPENFDSCWKMRRDCLPLWEGPGPSRRKLHTSYGHSLSLSLVEYKYILLLLLPIRYT